MWYEVSVSFQYGAVKGGSTFRFFRDNEMEPFKTMGQFMIGKLKALPKDLIYYYKKLDSIKHSK